MNCSIAPLAGDGKTSWWTRTASSILLLAGVSTGCSNGGDGVSVPNPGGGYVSGLALSAALDLDASGTVGGPFSPGGSYTLSNIGTQALNWTASASEPWIELSSSAGFLQVGDSTTITVSASGPAADGLSEGAYSGTIVFSDAADSAADISRPAFLTVLNQQTDTITIAPANGLSSSGELGGPFSPESITYTLTNPNSFDFDWGVALSEPWITVDGSNSGTLTPGASTDVTIRLSGALTAALPTGLHTGSVTFQNLGDSATAFDFRSVVLAISTTVGGWSEFTPSADSRVLYVSNNGSDSNDGLSPATAKRTIAAARALLRDGFPDWMLLERGSTWTETIGTGFGLAGRSPTEPIVIQDYGNLALPRPTITGVNTGFGFSAGAQYIALMGIRFVGMTDDTAINGHASLSDVLIENCFFDGANLSFQTPGSLGAPPQNVAIRRCVIINNGEDGLFTNEAQFFLVEECLFYNNGLHDEIRKHNIYMSGNNGPDAQAGNGHDSTNNTVRGCFLLKAGGNAAIKWRAQFNGLIERNFISRNRITVGMHTKWPNEYSLNNVFRDNVIVEQGNPDVPSNMRGVGVNGVWGAEVSNNIIARNTTENGGNHAIGLLMPQYDDNPDYAGEFFPSSRDVVIRDNVVYGWNGNNLVFSGARNMITNNYANVQVINNEFQNPSPDTGIVKRLVDFGDPARFGSSGVTFSGNTYWSSWTGDQWFRDPDGLTYSQWVTTSGETGSSNTQMSYTDPNRTLGTYAAQLGIGSDFDDFVNAAILQEKGNWDEDLGSLRAINYVREGFDKAPLQ